MQIDHKTLYLSGNNPLILKTNGQIKNNPLPDLSASLLKNLVLKTKILTILFSVIFTAQAILISLILITRNPIAQSFPKKIMVFGPLFLLMAAFFELLYLFYLKKQSKKNIRQTTLFTYIIAFIEISFPALVLLMLVSMAGNLLIIPVNEILNSPPFILYFIFIILSSLHLDKKLCTFSGLIAGTQYACICIYFKNHYNLEALFVPNIIAKSILIFVCGLVAGFVSKKIKLALIDALQAQNKLINELDAMVTEKTQEITQQKTEIEKQHFELREKNKEIVDSIHYAKRIQNSLMPTEKYIHKNINRN